MPISPQLSSDLERLDAIRRELDGMDVYAADTNARIYDLNNELRPLHARVYGDAKERVRLKRYLTHHDIPYDQEAPMAVLQELASFISAPATEAHHG